MSYLAALEDEVRDAVAKAAESAAPELTHTLYRQFADTGNRYGYERPYFERRGRLVVGSACSGHGFKFAPAIGRRLADLALS